MAYFSDAFAHSTLLGFAISEITKINYLIAIFIIGIILSLAIATTYKNKLISFSSTLGFLSHALLAFGLILFALKNDNHIELHHYLLGDLNYLQEYSSYEIIIVTISLLLIIRLIWDKLLLISINNEIAEVENIKITNIIIIFLSLLSFIISLSLKPLGVLMITGLIIIPATTARILATSVKQMIIITWAILVLSISNGILLSHLYQLDFGPIVVCIAFIIFLIIAIIVKIRQFSNKKTA